MKKKHSTQSSLISRFSAPTDNDKTLDEAVDDSVFGLDVMDDSGQSPAIYQRRYTSIDSIDERMGNELKSVGSKLSLPISGVFKHLSPVVKKRLLQVGRRIHYQAGASLNSVGDPCQGLSFILGGKVRVEWMAALKWVSIAMLGPGDVFGAMEWAESKIWEERLSAKTETLVLFIPSTVLNPLNANYPDLQRQVERYAERHTLHSLLGAHALFQDISSHDLMHLIDIATMRYLDTGAMLYGPERVISLLFVVGRGELELSCEERVIQSIGRGEIVNLELALGDGINLTTARVSSPATLYLLPFDQIEETLARANQLQTLQKSALLLRSRALND
ncbi:MAG: hypothetical protein CMH49_03160 [Myxococcales bacterium]|nr:hypothetical protein [Myxococcales bacterium]